MSALEKAITDNTAALRELTAALLAGGAKPAKPAKPAAAPVHDNTTAVTVRELSYQTDVREFALKLNVKDRSALKALAEKHGGAGKPVDVPVENLAAFLADVKAAL